LKQEDYEFEISLDNLARLHFKNKKQKLIGHWWFMTVNLVTWKAEIRRMMV
jgi:hypothetical protein